MEEAVTAIHDMVDGNANIIFGTVFDESLKGEMKVTLLATGLRNGKEEQLHLGLDNLPRLQAVETMGTAKGGLFRRNRRKKVAIPEGFVGEPALSSDLDIPTFIRWGK
ncbi:MAG: Cell division protein FtsZ [Dehalococcoidia bacterium]|nr:Cell division protein FtsZ [Bacillota bacterium]